MLTSDKPLQAALALDISLQRLRQAFELRFADNAPQALVIYLSMLSGGTPDAFSVISSAPSAAGKTYTAEKVGELLPPGAVHFNSQATVAGLFALGMHGQLHTLVLDEATPDAAFKRIRRQLLSTGRAERILSTHDGQIRKEIIRGPVAIIECHLADSAEDFQDISRALLLKLAVNSSTTSHHVAAALGHRCQTTDEAELAWLKLRQQLRKLPMAQRPSQRPVFFDDKIKAIELDARWIHLPRRIQQLKAVAATIARFRSAEQSNCEQPLVVSPIDLRDAAELILAARVQDDTSALPQRTLATLQILDHLFETDPEIRTFLQRGVTVGHLVEALNRPMYAELAARVVDVSKRRGPAKMIGNEWTRRALEPHLLRLSDVGLLRQRRASGWIFWSIPAHAREIARAGHVSAFQMLLEAVKVYAAQERSDAALRETQATIQTEVVDETKLFYAKQGESNDHPTPTSTDATAQSTQ